MKNNINKILLGLMLAFTTQLVSAVETVTYYHNDALGSPVAATDSNGAILWKEDYHPYGSRIRKQNSDTNQAWYTGKHHESDIDLSYFGARWYDPNIGRFMAIDPVGFKEGNIHSHNRYAYANNNPYVFVDPDGRESVDSVEERMSTGKTLRHPAGGSSSSFPDTMNPVPGFSPPMSSGELIGTIGSFAGPGGAIRQSVKWGVGASAGKKGTTVIGHLPNYPDVAKKMGANYLKPSKGWNFKKQGEFMKKVMDRGDDIFIGTKIRRGPSVLKKEIKQAVKNGYKPKEQGSKWLVKD